MLTMTSTLLTMTEIFAADIDIDVTSVAGSYSSDSDGSIPSTADQAEVAAILTRRIARALRNIDQCILSGPHFVPPSSGLSSVPPEADFEPAEHLSVTPDSCSVASMEEGLDGVQYCSFPCTTPLTGEMFDLVVGSEVSLGPVDSVDFTADVEETDEAGPSRSSSPRSVVFFLNNLIWCVSQILREADDLMHPPLVGSLESHRASIRNWVESLVNQGSGLFGGILRSITGVPQYVQFRQGCVHYRAAQRAVVSVLFMPSTLPLSQIRVTEALSDMQFHLRVALRLFSYIYEAYV